MRNGAGKPVTELRHSLLLGRGRGIGRRFGLGQRCGAPLPGDRLPYACPQDLPSSVAAGAPPNAAVRYGHHRIRELPIRSYYRWLVRYLRVSAK